MKALKKKGVKIKSFLLFRPTRYGRADPDFRARQEARERARHADPQYRERTAAGRIRGDCDSRPTESRTIYLPGFESFLAD